MPSLIHIHSLQQSHLDEKAAYRSHLLCLWEQELGKCDQKCCNWCCLSMSHSYALKISVCGHFAIVSFLEALHRNDRSVNIDIIFLGHMTAWAAGGCSLAPHVNVCGCAVIARTAVISRVKQVLKRQGTKGLNGEWCHCSGWSAGLCRGQLCWTVSGTSAGYRASSD